MKTAFANSVLGILMISVGVGFLLDTLGLIEFGRIAGDWWPSVIILIGVLSLLSKPSNFGWPAVIIGSGVLLLLRELDVLEFNVWGIIGPAILITIGTSLLVERFGAKSKDNTRDRTESLALLSDDKIKSASHDYPGGKVTALLGDITLDLRNADIKKSATINMFCLMGDIEILVPKTWNVQADVLALLGDWKNNTVKPAEGKAPTLIVNGTCLIGDIKITN